MKKDIKYRNLKQATFEEGKGPLALTDGTDLEVLVKGIELTPDRLTFFIKGQEDEKVEVKITEHLKDEHYFVFMSSITGKKLVFKAGLLHSLSTPESKDVKVLGVKVPTKTPDRTLLLNRD